MFVLLFMFVNVLCAASEDSDWSKVPSETSWPSLPGGESTVTSQDTLESVLGKLGLLDYYNLLQVRCYT